MEQALIDLLLATTSVTALIDDRLTPGVRTQGGDLPALVLNVFPSERGYFHGGDDGLPRARIQLDAYAVDYVGARDLIAAVMTRLSGFAGVVSGVRLTILDAREETGFDHNSPDRTFRRSMDCTVWAATA